MADAEATSSNAEPNSAYFAGEPSSNPPEEQENNEEIYEPETKRKKTEKSSEAITEKLEQRLGGILCCAVCLDLPRAAVYQCTNGHLMCAGCFTHLLADARLRDEVATCPNCRVEIGRTSASRNLAVEKAVSELPAECTFCNREFPRNSLDRHQESLCEERITSCRFARIGCPWRGPWHEASSHEAACAHPTRSGLEVMEALQAASLIEERERHLYDSIFELLSYEKITFNDLQMKPYRSDELVHKLFYETSRFSAFNNQWVVKARVTGSQRDPTQSSHREITYQLILKTKTAVPMSVHHLVVHGPFGDARVIHRINRFDFSDQDSESPEVQLPLADAAECNRLLASKAINFRLIMFLVSK